MFLLLGCGLYFHELPGQPAHHSSRGPDPPIHASVVSDRCIAVVVDCDNSNPSRPVVSGGERCDRATSLHPSLIAQKNADLEAGAIPYRLKSMAMLCMSWPF